MIRRVLAWLVIVAFAASVGGVTLAPAALRAALVHSAATEPAMGGMDMAGPHPGPCEHHGKAACGGACPFCATVVAPSHVAITPILVAVSLPPRAAASDQPAVGVSPGRLDRPPRSNG
jgi:hypothetical protein